MSDEDIWNVFDEPLGSIGKVRIMEKIKTPPFKSPGTYREFQSGNQHCRCVCETKYLPRNAILIRPRDITKAKPIYELMEKAWRLGRLKWLSVGSCQNFIQTSTFKREFFYILKHASVNCIDNIDNSKLKAGDVLLTRHGDKLVGKPHLILDKVKDGENK